MREWIIKCRELPFISGALVIMNIAVYLINIIAGETLYSLGRLSVVEVIFQKEYGRVIWSMFLHSGINHIFNNMMILFFLGAMIEQEVGHIRFAVFYFLSGIGGNLLSLFFKIISNDWSASIGASGAVFGLDGVLLALVLFSGRKLPTVTPVRVVLMIVLSLYSGFTGQYIDNAAHVGGLLTGFLAGTLMCIVDRRRIKRQRNG